MKFAYADPPYFGYAGFYADLHAESAKWDDLAAHQELISGLSRDYDGWALSLTSGNLFDILPLVPRTARVGAWVKPFCSYKKHVSPAYAWEPVIFQTAKKHDIANNTVRDWLAENITLKRGLTGAKPAAFCEWILDLLGFDHTQDTLDDLFPGTGIMGQVIAGRKCDASVTPLFAEGVA
jgi:hypothetical protein